MLEKSQIISLVDDLLNQKAKLRKGGTQATYYCFKCNHPKRKLEINLENFIFHCWTCNLSGNVFSLGKLLNAPQSYYEQLHKLIGENKPWRSDDKKEEDDKVVLLPDEFHPLYKIKNSPEYKNAAAYLKRRNVTEEDIIRYNIGYAESGEYAYHIIIPSYNGDGDLNFFVARRYYNVDGGINYKKCPFSMNIVAFEIFVNWNESYVNLVEGCFDAFAVRNNVIPLFGKYPSKKLQEKLITNNVKRVNMILDNDALEDAVKNYELLIRTVPGIEVYIVKLNGKDPADLGFEKTHELIKNSKQFDEESLMEYKLSI